MQTRGGGDALENVVAVSEDAEFDIARDGARNARRDRNSGRDSSLVRGIGRESSGPLPRRQERCRLTLAIAKS